MEVVYNKPKVCCITCTKNRHTCLERSVRLFLNQDYENSVQLIYNNSCTTQSLDPSLPNKRFILVNNCKDLVTGKPYTNLGAIYRDAITFIPEDVDLVSFWDDDDLFLSDHISEGVKGFLRGGKTAYKPKKSLYKQGKNAPVMVENTLEPSIFVKKDHIFQYGFGQRTSDQHMEWVEPLVRNGEIYVDPNGKPTLIYTWGNPIPVFKTSGNSKDPENFKSYEAYSRDVGDQIITPISKAAVDRDIAH